MMMKENGLNYYMNKYTYLLLLITIPCWASKPLRIEKAIYIITPTPVNDLLYDFAHYKADYEKVNNINEFYKPPKNIEKGDSLQDFTEKQGASTADRFLNMLKKNNTDARKIDKATKPQLQLNHHDVKNNFLFKTVNLTFIQFVEAY